MTRMSSRAARTLGTIIGIAIVATAAFVVVSVAVWVVRVAMRLW